MATATSKYTPKGRTAPVNPPNFGIQTFVTAKTWRQNPQALIQRHRDEFPQPLLGIDNWTGNYLRWKSELKQNGELQEKYDKVPVNPHGEYFGKWGSSTDSTTWGSFEEAAQCFLADARVRSAERARVHGIGIVLTSVNGIVVFDFDKCVENGEITKPEVRDIIAGPLNGSFTEKSMTSGAHTYCELPKGVVLDEGIHNNELGFEIYPTARFVATTADRLPDSPREIRPVDWDWLKAIYEKHKGSPTAKMRRVYTVASDSIDRATHEDILEDRRVINRMLAAPCDEDCIRRLFVKGDTTAWGATKHSGADDSSADFALLNHIYAFSKGDPLRIDRIFRKSALMRDKWDDRRGSTTYGWFTINNLLDKRIREANERAAAQLSGEIF